METQNTISTNLSLIRTQQQPTMMKNSKIIIDNNNNNEEEESNNKNTNTLSKEVLEIAELGGHQKEEEATWEQQQQTRPLQSRSKQESYNNNGNNKTKPWKLTHVVLIGLELLILILVIILLALFTASKEGDNNNKSNVDYYSPAAHTYEPSTTTTSEPSSSSSSSSCNNNKDDNTCCTSCQTKEYVVNKDVLSFTEHLVLAMERNCHLATVTDENVATEILEKLIDANLPYAYNNLPVAFVGLMRFLDDPNSWRWVVGNNNGCCGDDVTPPVPVLETLWTGIEPNGGYAGEAFGAMYFEDYFANSIPSIAGGLLDVPTRFKLPAVYECCGAQQHI